MNVERIARSGQIARHLWMRSSVFEWRSRTPHRLQHGRRGMLKRNVEVGEDFALGHQANHVIDMRVRVDVVQSDPGSEVAERLAEIEEPGGEIAAFPWARGVLRSSP